MRPVNWWWKFLKRFLGHVEDKESKKKKGILRGKEISELKAHWLDTLNGGIKIKEIKDCHLQLCCVYENEEEKEWWKDKKTNSDLCNWSISLIHPYLFLLTSKNTINLNVVYFSMHVYCSPNIHTHTKWLNKS